MVLTLVMKGSFRVDTNIEVHNHPFDPNALFAAVRGNVAVAVASSVVAYGLPMEVLAFVPMVFEMVD